MEITINLIELSSDLAEEMVKIKFNYKENDIYIQKKMKRLNIQNKLKKYLMNGMTIIMIS